MTARDTHRSAFYAAERMVFNVFDRAGPSRTAQLAGTTLTVPVEARFGSIASITEYVSRVLALPAVRTDFPRARLPVSVRGHSGFRQATYRRTPPQIAVPTGAGGDWAMRELVIVHELAHHLDDSDGPAHGPTFAATLITLSGMVLGPEAELLYRVVLSDAGVA